MTFATPRYFRLLQLSYQALHAMADPNAALQELRRANLQNMRRPRLQRYCSRLGLLATGSKADLIARIQPLLATGSSTPITSAPGSSTITTTANTSGSTSTHVTPSTSNPPLLPPNLSNVTMSSGPTWLQSIATQAAQSAIQQALTMVPSIQSSGPTTTTVTQTAPYSPPTITAPITTLSPAVMSAPGSISLLPHQAAASITGYNLPGELPGMLTQSTIQKILSLQFVELSTLLPGNQALNDSQPIQIQIGGEDSQQLLLSRRPQTRRQISSIRDWFVAFSAYAAVLTTADPSRGADLFEYARIIALAEQEHSGNAWQRYDVAFRRKAANKRLTKWSDIDPTLWNRAFSGQSRPSAFCSICLDASHTTTSCPLYAPGPGQIRSTALSGPSSVGRKPICINFNRGTCKRNPCPRRHKCLTVGCEGDHPYTECPRVRSSPRKNKQ